MIAIVDYGVGNLFSLQSSLQFLGIDVVVTNAEKVLRDCEKIILPGVGAFADAMEKLKQSGLDKVIIEECGKGKPLLGICLGMQMLFERSLEYGDHQGLGLIQGSVEPISEMIANGLKVPHIGWNGLIFPKDKEKSKLYEYVKESDCVYYVHSFAAIHCDCYVTAQAEYGGYLTGSVEKGNVYGTQFHPEKSGEVGLGILKAFCELV
ncbi:MAG: imidazole glycerol phosphate synthase subunit HisH [Bacillota bacterium]